MLSEPSPSQEGTARCLLDLDTGAGMLQDIVERLEELEGRLTELRGYL